MKPSKRRSQIDPKRLSNITNPPMYLQPTPTSQSSPFSYTATPTFAYKSRLEDDGAKENNTGLLFLAASPPSGAQTSSPETQTLTPLDRYSHLFDKFPARPSASSPSLLSHSEAQVRGRPSVPNWRLPQIQMATPASPRPTKKRLSGLNGPRPHLGSMNKPLSAAAYALASETRTKVKRKSRHRSNSPLRNVVTPSFEWQAPNHTDDVWTTDQPKIQSTESEQSADGNRGESWSIKSLETEAEKCDSLPPRTLQLVNQLRRMNSEYDGDGLFRMLQADVQTPAVSTELGTQVKSHCFAKDEDEIGVARTCDEPANNSKINMSTAEDTAGGHRRRNQIPDRSSQKANSDDLSDAGRSLQDRIRREARPSLDRSTSPPIKTEPTPSQTFTPPKEPLISQDESPTLGRANLFNFYNPTNGSTSKDSILNAPFFIAPNTSPSSSRACSPTLPGLPALTNVHTHVEPRPLSSFPTATSDSSDVSDAKGDKLLDLDPLDAELCATVSVPLRTAYAYAGPSVEDRANANATATRRSCRVQHEGRFGAIGSERERAGAGTGAGAHHRFPSCISPSFSALRGIRAVEGRGGGGGGGANRGGAAGIVVQHAEGSGDAGDPFSPAPVVARAAAWPTAFAGEGNAAANRAANPTANCNSNRLSGHVTRLGAPATGTGSGITPSASGSSFDPRVVGLGIGMLGRELEWSFD
ncbi:MAG: hypothetical protein LQ340_001791 [Diploschistes diacapsis]|nr:MAG: hypothetical protein LQ340_001791 [Diploschistes diacapsis]